MEPIVKTTFSFSSFTLKCILLKYEESYHQKYVKVKEILTTHGSQWTSRCIKKILLILVSTFAFMIVISTPTFAGEWRQKDNKWWYQNDDGSYPYGAWKEVDGKLYYFDESGYMLKNSITPDGFRVGAQGTFPDTTNFNGGVYRVWNSTNIFSIKDKIIFVSNRDGSSERAIHTFNNFYGWNIYYRKNIVAVGDWLYVLGSPIEYPDATLIRMKADGSNLQILLKQKYENINFTGKGIYFTYIKDHASIDPQNYSYMPPSYFYNLMNFDGSGLIEISKEEFDKYNTFGTLLRPDLLYSAETTNVNNKGKITFYKINSDGSRTIIHEIKSNSRNLDYSHLGLNSYNSNLMYFVKNQTITTDNMWDFSSKNTLCSINLHTKEIKEYQTNTKSYLIYNGKFYVNDKYIFCISSKEDNYSLIRMNLDGSGATKICEGDGTIYNIDGGFGNYIYWGDSKIVDGGI